MIKYDPEMDLYHVLNVLRNDEVLKTLLEIPAGQAPGKYIVERFSPDLIVNGQNLLFVFFAPSRETNNPLCSFEILQIECHVPSQKSMRAHKILKRVRDLLHLKIINGKQIYFIGQQGQMGTISGYFCAGARYRYTVVL